MGWLRTDFLFAAPSFLSGVARSLDLFGWFDYYNHSKDGNEADARAMYSDWSMVGRDLMEASAKVKASDSKQLHLKFSE